MRNSFTWFVLGTLVLGSLFWVSRELDYLSWFGIMTITEAIMKNILKWFVFGALVLGCLFVVSCKNNDYDIRGTWTVTITGSESNDSTRTFIFSGDKEQGSVEIQDILSDGTYTVNDKTVEFKVTYGVAAPQFRDNFVGEFNSETDMSGSYTLTFNEESRDTGNWTANR